MRVAQWILRIADTYTLRYAQSLIYILLFEWLDLSSEKVETQSNKILDEIIIIAETPSKGIITRHNIVVQWFTTKWMSTNPSFVFLEPFSGKRCKDGLIKSCFHCHQWIPMQAKLHQHI